VQGRPPETILNWSLSFPRLVFAGCGVDASVRQDQPGDWGSTEDVGFDDFVYVADGDVAIPDCFGINHDRRAVLALLEASRFVGADSRSCNSPDRQCLLEFRLQLAFGFGIATAPRMSRWALVAADENMLFEFGHK
jgi:hypothetical protein